MKYFRTLLPILVLLAGAAIATLIFTQKPAAKKKPEKRRPLAVEVMSITPQNHQVTLQAQGVVEARTVTTLSPRVSGEIIKVSPHFRPGGFFDQGHVLLHLDDVDYQLALKTAEADVAEAKFKLIEAQAQAAQAKDNWQQLSPGVEASDLVLRKPQLARAQASVQAAEARALKARLDLQRTQIKAPYRGRILEQFVDIGQHVQAGENLAQIFATNAVEIRLPLSEKQRAMLNLPFAFQGQAIEQKDYPAATVTAEINGQHYQWPGTIVRREASLDSSTRQSVIVVEVKHPYRANQQQRPPLDIGQYVKVTLNGRLLEQVFKIPRSAMQGDNMVMTVKDNRLQRKNVNPVWEEQDAVYIHTEFSADERLSVNYISYAADNVKVKAIPSTQ